MVSLKLPHDSISTTALAEVPIELGRLSYERYSKRADHTN